MLLKGAYCVGEHFVDPQCLIPKLKGSNFMSYFIHGHQIEQLITDKLLILERICLHI